MSSSPLALVKRADIAAPPGQERVFCAYHIPYLPAWLPPRAEGESRAFELSRDMFRQQTNLISGLAHWQEQGIALRYLWQPDEGQVDVAVLLRVRAPQGSAGALAQEIGSELTRDLGAAGIATVPVASDAELLKLLMPENHVYLAEVRQQEDVVALRAGGAYSVYPYRPAPSTWHTVFEQLTRQPAPCVLNIHLQPTRLSPAEREVFGEAAGLAQSLEDFRYSGYTTVEHRDPLAEVVGALYAGYLERLRDPVLAVVQVASPDHRAVQATTAVLAQQLSERMDVREARASGQLPAGAQVVIPRTSDDAALAQQTLTLLELQPWGDAATRPEQRRLPYLMDAATAAAAFRFPVAVEGHIPGIATRMAVPGSDGRPVGKIFLSYRRGDSAGVTGRIYDRLAARYGKDAVYLDVSTIPAGIDYMEHLLGAIRASAVQLVLVGPRWLDAVDSGGNRRLDLPDDAVRQEVETGLASPALVIPVLLDGTPMPAREKLPAPLQPLCALNSRAVRHADFDQDIQRLIDAIDEQMRRSAGSST